ncbi:MAG: ankyrin repeat domain-containing protein [bacterium]|nr:ankyrin repeat domain-containing protein [bacterium]
MRLKILSPEKLRAKAVAKLKNWKREKALAEKRGIPKSADVSFVMRNLRARKALSDKEKGRLDSELINTAHELDAEGREAKITRLLEAGADVNVRDGKGWTPLMVEGMAGPIEGMMEMLIAYGAEVDLQNDKGNTALHVAAEYNNSGGAEILANAGADPDIKNNEGKDVMDCCVWVSNSVAFVINEVCELPLPPEFFEDVDEDGNQMESLAAGRDGEGARGPVIVDDEDSPF